MIDHASIRPHWPEVQYYYYYQALMLRSINSFIHKHQGAIGFSTSSGEPIPNSQNQRYVSITLLVTIKKRGHSLWKLTLRIRTNRLMIKTSICSNTSAPQYESALILSKSCLHLGSKKPFSIINNAH